MKRGTLDNMKVLQAKKARDLRLRYTQTYMQSYCPETHYKFIQDEKESIVFLINSIGETSADTKEIIIDYSLKLFLKNKKPLNLSYMKYLRNFHKFNAFSLICATSYLKRCNLVTKGDIRTFIYIYLAFNLLSSKFLDDYAVWNSSFISLWGISHSQAIQLEIFALQGVNYILDVEMSSIQQIIENING